MTQSGAKKSFDVADENLAAARLGVGLQQVVATGQSELLSDQPILPSMEALDA
ncbi:hypothetical protein K3U93_16515 [Mycobacterium malmoense]|uniref:hypothetical protein n=1 Tax=Mycobacterium malmoense TaxID=1780 RepID=UPI001594400D|nr:hypothetical protein [Mycobacterium malmoense]QZA16281.1 hypothetical protein K3U93_16515 [Mycobacterium malmoense]UNB93087.1 hypothetical protein H5T25_16500 [Mycobacterium malmoense]